MPSLCATLSFLTLLGFSTASNFTFYSDTYCSEILATIPFGQTGDCIAYTETSTLPQSVRFHLQDFVSADIAGTAFVSSKCTTSDGSFSVTVENESPNPQYPIANDQCVSAEPNGATFAAYRWAAWR